MLSKFVLPLAAAAALSAASAQASLLQPGSPVLPAVQTGSSAATFDPILGFVATGPGVATLTADVNPDGSLGLLGGAFTTLVDGLPYSGAVSAVGFEIDPGTNGGDVLQFLVDLQGGPFLEGGLVTYTGEFGTITDAPFEVSFTELAAEYTLQTIGVVPLPAGLPMIAGALFALFAVGRRRATA